MTILDWRNNEYKKQCEEFAEQYNINIRVYSIISGTIEQFDEKVHVNGEIPVVSEFAAVYGKHPTKYI